MLNQIRLFEKKIWKNRIREPPNRCILPIIGCHYAERKRVLMGKYWNARTEDPRNYFIMRESSLHARKSSWREFVYIACQFITDDITHIQIDINFKHTQWYMVVTLDGISTRSNGHEYNYFIKSSLQFITTIQVVCLSWDVGKLDATRNSYSRSSNIVMPVI